MISPLIHTEYINHLFQYKTIISEDLKPAEIDQVECPVCMEKKTVQLMINCNVASHTHSTCLDCLNGITDRTPPSFPLQCPLCRGPYQHDLFRLMPSFGDVEDPELWIHIMRSCKRNIKVRMSEYNFIAILAAMKFLTKKIEIDDNCYFCMPECVIRYLEKCSEEKKKEWTSCMVRAANNLMYEMLHDISFDRSGCKTSFSCEDATLIILWKYAGGPLDPTTCMRNIFDNDEIESLSRVDPRDEEEEEDDDDDDDDGRMTSYSTQLEFMQDDMDIDFLWTIRGEFIEATAPDGTTTYLYKDKRHQTFMLYSVWMNVANQVDMVCHHPDMWFAPIYSCIRANSWFYGLDAADEELSGQSE